MGRIGVDLPDELEKQFRIKTVERFGGKKGDLSRAVEEAVRTWIANEKEILQRFLASAGINIGNNIEGFVDPK